MESEHMSSQGHQSVGATEKKREKKNHHSTLHPGDGNLVPLRQSV